MPGIRDMRVLARLFLAVCVMVFAPAAIADEGASAKEQALRQQNQPLNNAPVWREVRKGENAYQTSQVRGIESTILVQSEGETWRRIRNGPITVYGGWLIAIAAFLIGLFYVLRGAIKLHGQPTGRMIERFSSWDRIVHWAVAISFVILAVSGIVMLFGKYILLPVFGYTLFSWLAILCKNLHNFVGPLFAVCIVLMLATYIKDNLPKAYDIDWFAKAGGMFGGAHVPSGRFNAGEKAWFWIGVTVLGLVVSTTGLVLDFPNFAQGRGVMQQANVIHAIAAVLFMAMSIGHIYLGTIGVSGAYEAMRNGSVDETWAKEHHEYWYNDMKGQARAAGGNPSAAHASAMKEGWKL